MAIYDPLLALPKPQKIALGVVGIVVVGALAFFLLIQPLWDERDALWNSNEGLRAKVIQARADEATCGPSGAGGGLSSAWKRPRSGCP
jgi:hypothetical protein